MTLVAILHNIRSVHNAASMFRTADGAGVSKIYLTGVTPTPLDRFGRLRKDFVKVSLGAETDVPWERHRSAPALIEKLKAEGFVVLALEQSRRSLRYDRIPRKYLARKKLVLVVGHEVHGIPSNVLRAADAVLEIPMRGAVIRQARHPRRTRRGKESLNVSVAFGIAAYRLSVS